ncbi:hypothetical protein D9M69_617040 [compost metagenome]
MDRSMRVIHLVPAHTTNGFKLAYGTTQRDFLKLFVGLDDHLAQSPTSMWPALPLPLAMNANVLEEQLS